MNKHEESAGNELCNLRLFGLLY